MDMVHCPVYKYLKNKLSTTCPYLFISFFFFTTILYYMHYHGNWHLFSMTIALLWLSLLLFYSPHFFPFSTKTMEHSLFYYIICTTTNFLPPPPTIFLFYFIIIIILFTLYRVKPSTRVSLFIFIFLYKATTFLLSFIFYFLVSVIPTPNHKTFFIFYFFTSKI